jgi:hypothetical protein
MKKALLLIFIITLAAITSAQQITSDIQWTKKIIPGNVYIYDRMIPLGYDSTGMYAIWFPAIPAPNEIVLIPRQICVTHLTPEMEMAPLVPLNLKEGGVHKDFEFAVKLDNEYYVFSSFQNQRLKKTFLFAQTIDKNSLELNSEHIKIAEIDYSEYSKFKNASFEHTLSPDSSKILIRHVLLEKDGEVISMGLSVFSQKLTPLWETTNVATGDVNLFRFEKFDVNNNGDVFILGKAFENIEAFRSYRKPKIRGLFPLYYSKVMVEYPKFEYRLMSLTQNGNLQQNFKLTLSGDFVKSLSMTPLDEESVICAGVYSRNNTYSAVGSCSFIVHPGKNQITVNHSPFDEDLITQGLDKRELKRFSKGNEFDDNIYFPHQLVVREDGGSFMLFEQVKQTVNKKNSKREVFSTWMMNDILISGITSSGEIEWVKRIEKRHWLTGYLGFNFTSLGVYPQGDNLFIFYTNIEDLSTTIFGKLKNPKAIMIHADPLGNIKSEVISTIKEDDVIIMPRYMGMFSPSTLMLTGRSSLNRRFRFVKIDLPEATSISR